MYVYIINSATATFVMCYSDSMHTPLRIVMCYSDSMHTPLRIVMCCSDSMHTPLRIVMCCSDSMHTPLRIVMCCSDSMHTRYSPQDSALHSRRWENLKSNNMPNICDSFAKEMDT
jgi:hypothetical protein